MYQIREANQMVEEFMLAANISVAEKILNHYPICSLLRYIFLPVFPLEYQLIGMLFFSLLSLGCYLLRNKVLWQQLLNEKHSLENPLPIPHLVCLQKRNKIDFTHKICN